MILHPFEPPNPVHHKYKNSEWRRTAPHDIKHPDFLWEDYWQRFNTMQIPLFDEDEYYDTAIAIAKESNDRQEFEEKFERKTRQQRKKLLAMLDHALGDALSNAETFKSNDAWLTAIYASQTGCFQYFVRLLEAAASGREAVLVDADAEFESPRNSDAGEDMSKKTQNSGMGARDVVPGVQAHADYRGYPYMDGPMPRYWAAQHPDDYEWNYKTRSECNGRDQTPSDDFILTVPAVEYTTSKPSGTAPDSTSRTSTVQQLPPLSSDGHLVTEDDENATQEASTSLLVDDGSTALTKKRVRSDEDATAQKPKRRKLEHDGAPSTRQASRKRSRSDEDGEDNGYKRQKIESLPSPPTSHTSSADFEEDTTTDDDPSVNLSDARESTKSGNPSKSLGNPDADTVDGKRQRRKGGSVSHTTRAKASQTSPNRRSSRRGKSSPLWELDSSGKPHSRLVREKRWRSVQLRAWSLSRQGWVQRRSLKSKIRCLGRNMVVILAGLGAAAQFKQRQQVVNPPKAWSLSWQGWVQRRSSRKTTTLFSFTRAASAWSCPRWALSEHPGNVDVAEDNIF
ncbi:hypothetical protein BBK36DRAFT_1117021 [Trichoderma citrinoviride]|uniref:Uncharacterized protein n=1 Tax=Trichoderma citrinoviride TaxID=58853 RepID=A0A2T4BC89_9HYPO|nr:hypothetical protein BBK36DRAFT_1117021 [Trichoderma citrinoviride]PTB66950.1 hypothetical protein BBK36DRAFT_1117021 [Trichoderma citrinoviride]